MSRRVVEPEDCDEEEMARHKPVCYFVMNNGCIKETNVFFDRPYEGIKSHLEPFFLKSKVKDTTIKKILVDGGAAINLMPHFLLRKIGKYDTDLRPHNTVLSDYTGKSGHTMGIIHVDLTVRSITWPNVFMVITSKASYNLLLGREWIHGI